MSRSRIFLGWNYQMHPMNHFRIWIYCAPCVKQRLWLKCAPSNFWDLSQINSIYALLSQIQLCHDYKFSWGHSWLKVGGGGRKNILMDGGWIVPINCQQVLNNDLSIWAMLCDWALILKWKKCFCRQGNEEDFPEPESDTVNISWSCEKNALKQYHKNKVSLRTIW